MKKFTRTFALLAAAMALAAATGCMEDIERPASESGAPTASSSTESSSPAESSVPSAPNSTESVDPAETGKPEDSIARGTLTEIFESADAALKESYRNLKLPETLTLDRVDALYTYECAQFERDFHDPETLRKFVTGILGEYRESYESIEELPTDSVCYRDKNLGFLARSRADLELTLTRDPAYYAEGKRVKIWQFDRGDQVDPSDTVWLNGKSCNVKTLLNNAESILNEQVTPYIPVQPQLVLQKTRIKKAGVFHMQNGTDQFVAEAEFLLNGLPIDNSGEDRTAESTGYIINSPKYYISLDGVGIQTVSAAGTHRLEPPKKLDDRFVTLGGALRQAESFLAAQHMYEVKSIRMEYVSVSKAGEPVGDYRPFWHIVLDEQEGKTQIMDTASVYVDMVDGTVFFFDTRTEPDSLSQPKT